MKKQFYQKAAYGKQLHMLLRKNEAKAAALLSRTSKTGNTGGTGTDDVTAQRFEKKMAPAFR